MDRPSFESLFLEFASSLARRSTCHRLHVGCVITDPDHRTVYAMGYNGNFAGGPNGCDRTGPEAVGNCGCSHAESNAIVNNTGRRSDEKLVYLTDLPCVACAKLLVNLGGVRRVTYAREYRLRDGIFLLQAAGIDVRSTSDPVLNRASALK